MFPIWDVLKRPHQRSLLDTAMRGCPIRGWLGDTNRGDALGCTLFFPFVDAG